MATPLVTIEDGVMGSTKQGERIPNTETAYWMLNSHAGKNTEGNEVYHWDVIE